MSVRLTSLRVPSAAPTRVTVPRTNFANVPLKASRPAQLQGEFVGPVAALKGLCASFTQMVLSPIRQAMTGSRLPLLVECNNKKGLGVTLGGTRRKRAKTSGFRARMATANGRRVLAARRRKGRKVLCPAGVPKRK